MSLAKSGLFLGAAGIALMCCMDAVAKALGADLTAFQVVFVRYLGSALWLALWIALTRGTWPRLADIGPQTIRAAMLVATATMFFYAVANLPLAMVAALAMTAPLYLTLIGVVFFKEPTGPKVWMALTVGALGSATIIFGGGEFDAVGLSTNVLAWAAATLAPLTYAATLAVLKRHSVREEPAALTLGQSLIAAMLVLPLTINNVPQVTPSIATLMALIGMLGAVGFLLLIHGLRQLPVSIFAVIDYTSLLWATLLGFAFFNELPGLPFWLGASLILFACLINSRSSTTATAAG